MDREIFENGGEEALYRRRAAAAERRRRHTRQLVSFAVCAILFIAATVTLAAVTAHRVKSRQESAVPADITVPDWVTQSFLPLNDYSRPGTPLEEVKAVVVHYVGNPGTTAEQNRSYFENLATTHETSASSHFLVGLDGEIIQCVPLDEWSYCTSQANSYSIAIEVCHPDETGKFNDKTYASLVKLLRWLTDAYGLDRDGLLRHYDVTEKICPKYYVDHPDAWESLRDEVFEDK